VRPSAAILALTLAIPGGCGTVVGASFDDPTPQARIEAIERAGASGDRSALPRIVENLSSDDAAVRMAAIGALRRMTGQTLGYRFDAPEVERRAAIGRWKGWLSEGADAKP
jgi:hypothetical protein